MTRAIKYLAITSRENNPISFLQEAFFDSETIRDSKILFSKARDKKEKERLIIDGKLSYLVNLIVENNNKIVFIL